MKTQETNLTFDNSTMTGSADLDELALLLMGDYETYINAIEFPKFRSAKKEDDFVELLSCVAMFGTDEEKKEFYQKYGKKK